MSGRRIWGFDFCGIAAHSAVILRCAPLRASKDRPQSPVAASFEARRSGEHLWMTTSVGLARRYLHLRHCEEHLRRSNPSFFARRDGLLRFARNDGERLIVPM